MILIEMLTGGCYWEAADRQPITEDLPLTIPETANFEMISVIPEVLHHPLFGKVERRSFTARWSGEGTKMAIVINRHYKIRRFYTKHLTGKTRECA